MITTKTDIDQFITFGLNLAYHDRAMREKRFDDAKEIEEELRQTIAEYPEYKDFLTQCLDLLEESDLD